ncbi:MULTISPECIES: DUF6783 domain-containing protein [Blautia]|nr:DUF6783 domain-containing protein [Blautia wexlerae]
MYVTICGRFCPDEGVVAGYVNRIRENIPQSGACRLWK